MIHPSRHKIERTPEDLAELKAARERFQRDRPGIDDLVAEGYDEPVRHGDVMALLSTIATLKLERDRRGITLAELSERSGMDKGMLSRFENGKILNPTLSTLCYAAAIGVRLSMEVETGPVEGEG